MARPAIRDERREQILDAMYAVMAERGAAGASISEIAEAAGVARGALHYFFENKDEIATSLMRRLGSTYVELLDGYLERRIAKGSLRVVADIARYHFIGESDDALRRVTVWIDYWGQAASRPAIRDVVLEIQERARRVVLKALLTQRPELRALDDGAQRAHSAALLSLIEGGLLQWRIAADSAAPLDRGALGDAIAGAAFASAQAITIASADAFEQSFTSELRVVGS